MPAATCEFDLIPPLGGWFTPYGEYDGSGICAGDGDYSVWVRPRRSRKRSLYVARQRNSFDEPFYAFEEDDENVGVQGMPNRDQHDL